LRFFGIQATNLLFGIGCSLSVGQETGQNESAEKQPSAHDHGRAPKNTPHEIVSVYPKNAF
jgi:hypothetical protein